MTATSIKLVATVAILLVASLEAQPAAADTRVFIETNPLALAFRGASLGARVIVPAAPRWSFGGGAYAFTLPELFVDQLPGNADEGWDVAIRPAGYLSAERHLRDGGAGFGFGANLVVARFAIGNDATDDTTSFTQLYLVPRVSYTWLVWRDLYLQPSAGLELHVRLGGETTLGDLEFEPPTVQPLVGVVLGYRL